MITQSRLQELFDYENGQLIWKVARQKIRIGDVAGTLHNQGYLSVCIDYKSYLVHRLIFLFHHGYLPAFVDHKDRNKKNNCIDNLREATKTQNNANQKLHRTNKSGFRGVSWQSKSKKWAAYISINNKTKNLGLYETPEAAYEAYCKAAKSTFGEFASV